MNELLIDFESAIGIKQQLDDLDRRIRINANNIDSLHSNVQSINSKLAQIDPAMIRANFQNISSMQDTIKGLQTSIANNVQNINTLKQIATLQSKIYLSDKDIIKVNGIVDFMQKLAAKNYTNPFIVLKKEIEDYVNVNVTTLTNAMNKNRTVKFNGYAFSYGAGNWSSKKQIKVDGKVYSQNISIKSIEDGMSAVMQVAMQPMLTMKNAINSMLHDIKDNFGEIRSLSTNLINMQKYVGNMKSALPAQKLTMGVNAKYDELQKVLKNLNNGVTLSKAINFRDDVLRLKTIYNDFISKINVPSVVKVSDMFNRDAFGLMIGKGHNPYVRVQFSDGSNTTMYDKITDTPIAYLFEYVNKLIVNRISQIVTYNGLNFSNHIKRQFWIILQLINGTFNVLKQITLGNSSATYSKGISTSDKVSAQVYIEVSDVFVGNITGIFDHNVLNHVDKLAGGVSNLQGAFAYMKEYVPSSFNLTNVLKIPNDYSNALNVDISGNAINELNNTITNLKTQLINVQKEIASMKSKLDKLEHN